MAMTGTVTERERLIAIAEEYLSALAAREPSRLPISPDVRFTENCQPLALGTGLWRTCQSVARTGHHFVDIARGEVVYWGVVEEFRGPALFAVRLGLEGRLIDEIETVVARGGEFFEPDVVLSAPAEMHDPVPVELRLTREELAAAADAYFDAINLDDGSAIEVSPDTIRIVNGVADSAVRERGLSEEQQYLSLDIDVQLTEGHYNYIEAIRGRRHTVIDEERGLCHCVILFDHPGDITRPNGVRLFGAPNTMICFEVFKVTRQGFRQVWALGTAIPYGSRSGWSSS